MIANILMVLQDLELEYKGYAFRFRIIYHKRYGYLAAYVVHKCLSKTQFKKAAFAKGYWDDKNPETCISSYGTPWLFAEPLGMIIGSDGDLRKALQRLVLQIESVYGLNIQELHRKEMQKYDKTINSEGAYSKSLISS